MTAANNALTPVSMLGDAQRQWWQDQMKAPTTWKLWGNDESLLRMQVDLFKSIVDGLTQAVLNTAAGLTPFAQHFHDTIQADLQTAIAANQVPATFPTFSAYATGLGFKPSDVQNTVNGLVKLLPPYSLLTTVLLNADQWDGYNAERVSLMKYLSVNSIGNVVSLTGDTNAFMAGTVLDDYDGTQTPVMVDLATAGVSSSSLFHSYVETMNADVDGANWLRGLVEDNGFGDMDQTLMNNNAWLKYVDTNAQGYAVVELTPSQLTCSFRKLQPIDDSGAVPAAANAIAGTQVVTVAANVVGVTVVPT
jgi:alkaline phosphatase D